MGPTGPSGAEYARLGRVDGATAVVRTVAELGVVVRVEADVAVAAGVGGDLEGQRDGAAPAGRDGRAAVGAEAGRTGAGTGGAPRLQPVKLYFRSGRWVVSQVGSMVWYTNQMS